MSAVIQNEYTGNNSTTTYSFTFPYLKTSDIKASLDGVETTAFTLPNATTLQFNTAPGSNVKIKIFRETSVDDLTATFYAGSAIKSEDLNDNFTQNLYKTQEVGARALNTLGGTMTGNLTLDTQADLVFEGATADAHETTIKVVDPTADRTITFPNVTGTVVTTGDTGTVARGMIAADAIDGTKLADNAVNSEHYTDGSIDRVHLAADIVDGTKIADDSINSEHYVADSIDTEHYAPGSVDTTAIATGAVIKAKLAGDCVDGTKIQDESIDSEHYVDGSIDNEHIANNAINQTKMADDSIGAAEIIDNAVGEAALASNAVTLAKMADNSVGTSELVNDAVTEPKIADNAVTMAKLASGTLPSDITIASANIPNNTIVSTDIDDNAVTTAKIADQELKTLAGMQSGTASKLADSTALTADIADLNQIDGLTKQTTISDTDTSFPTSGAVVDYVTAQIAPLGGLEVIATEVAFPNTQPQAGVVISISDAGGVVFNGSGTSTTGRTVGGSTITINNAPSSLNNETLAAGVGLMVSSTGSGQVYNYHKILGKESDIKQLSDDINDFAERYRVGSSNPTSALDGGDLFFNTTTGKLLVYNNTNTAWEEAQSIGNFFISTLSPAFDGSTQNFTITNAPTNVQQIILSINGVIQKPNAGTGTPSEGFALDGSTVKLAAAPASGAPYFAIVMGSTVNIGTPSNNTVSSAVLQNSSVIEAKIANDAVTTNKIANGAVSNAKIVDGAINNAKVVSDAAIAGSKISPTFTSNVTISNNDPSILFTDGDANPDFKIRGNGGTLKFIDTTNNNADRMAINSDGHVDVYGNLDVGAGLDVTGNVTSTGNLTIGDSSFSNVNTAAQNLVIGTESSGSNRGLSIITHSANTGHLFFGDQDSGSQGGFRYQNGADVLQGYSGGSAPFYLKSNALGLHENYPEAHSITIRGASQNDVPLLVIRKHTDGDTNHDEEIGRIKFKSNDNNVDSGNSVSRVEMRAVHVNAAGAAKLDFYTVPNFTTDPIKRMTLNQEGRLCIGTDDAVAKLNVVNSSSDTTATGSGTLGSCISVSNPNTTNNNFAGIVMGDRTDSQDFVGAMLTQITNHTSNYGNIVFYTNGTGGRTEKLRIRQDGGITFNGDTAATNALDDYEEGTHETTVTMSGDTTFSYYSRHLAYTKIGRVVHLIGRINLTGAGGSSFAFTLPFAVADGGQDFQYETSNEFQIIRGNDSRTFRLREGTSTAICQSDGSEAYIGAADPHLNVNLTYFTNS